MLGTNLGRETAMHFKPSRETGDQAQVLDPCECLIEDGQIVCIPEPHAKKLVAEQPVANTTLQQVALDRILMVGKHDCDIKLEFDVFSDRSPSFQAA